MSPAPSGPSRKPVVCIVCLYGWPVFEPSSGGVFGGSEVRIAGIARGLARRGKLDVKMVVWDYGQGARKVREGIEFIAWPEKAPANTPTAIAEEVAAAPASARLSRYRFTRWATESWERGGAEQALAAVPWAAVMALRWSVRTFFRTKERVYWGIYMRGRYRLQEWRTWLRAAARIHGYLVPPSRFRLLDAVAPDVAVVHGATGISAEIIAWCVARGKPSVFLSGSDLDFLPEHKQGVATLYGDPGLVVAYAVENATAHVVQTPVQLERLKALYGRGATLVRNPIDVTRTFAKAEERMVLWVGKSDSIKRPELAIEVARRIPSARVILVMNPSDAELHRRVEAEAAVLPNVQVIPIVPFEQIESYFARAAVFLSTSRMEGFPNTFLQAAKYEVPVVSLAVDPAGMLEQHATGFFARGDMDALVREIQALLDDDRRRVDVGARGRAYVEQHHEREGILERLESVMLGAASATR
jgi:glycosyltransferase involved in cell wall biosynthesis